MAYNGTSLADISESRWPLDMIPIEALLIQYLRILPKRTPCYSVKQTFFSVPLDNVDADMPLAQDCRVPLSDPTASYYSRTCMHSTNLWVPFLVSISKGKLWNILVMP